MKHHLKLSLLATLLLGAGQLFAANEPLTVAVYDFKGEADAAAFGSKVTTLITADLTTDTNLVLVERQDLNKALNEQAFGVSGLISADAAAKIGQITGAKVLVAGQVVKTGGNHLLIVANVIGTETGRLYGGKVEGPTEKLTDLTADLSKEIARIITAQATNLLAVAGESHDALLARIIKNVQGTNRPSVSVNIVWPNRKGHSASAEGEFGEILLKAGFPVVDANSDRKPDIEITGVNDLSAGPRHGGMFSYRSVIELKVQERRSGTIVAYDRQEGTATDPTRVGADRTAQVNAVDLLAERVLPLLAK